MTIYRGRDRNKGRSQYSRVFCIKLNSQWYGWSIFRKTWKRVVFRDWRNLIFSLKKSNPLEFVVFTGTDYYAAIEEFQNVTKSNPARTKSTR